MKKLIALIFVLITLSLQLAEAQQLFWTTDLYVMDWTERYKRYASNGQLIELDEKLYSRQMATTSVDCQRTIIWENPITGEPIMEFSEEEFAPNWTHIKLTTVPTGDFGTETGSASLETSCSFGLDFWSTRSFDFVGIFDIWKLRRVAPDLLWWTEDYTPWPGNPPNPIWNPVSRNDIPPTYQDPISTVHSLKFDVPGDYQVLGPFRTYYISLW
jgi:hypothetical protein